MCAHYFIGGAKMGKLLKRVFLVMVTNLGKKHDRKLRKNMQNAYLGSIFKPRKTYLKYVLKVLIFPENHGKTVHKN